MAAGTDTEMTNGNSSIQATRGRTSAATDVWFWLRALKYHEKPTVWPSNEPEEILRTKPDSTFEFVGCKAW